MKRILLVLIVVLVAFQSQAQKFDLQGNRGARGLMPENTIPGMIKALEFGVNTLVMNAVISQDKQVVLSQEPYFNAEISLTPKGKEISLKDQKKYNIYKMDYEDVKKYDVGSKVHSRFPGQQKFVVSKPLLSETIDSVEAYVRERKLPKPNYSIEVKAIRNGDNEFQPEPGEFVELIMNVIKRKKMEKRVTIQSFDIRALQYLHSKYPRIKTGLLIDEKEDFENNIKELGFNPTIYSPYSVLVGKGLVDRCHAAGIKIIPWVINSTKEMRYLINLGVDGLVTDYPNVYQKLKD